MREHWAEISENLKKMLDSGVFKVWIAPLRAVVAGDCLQLTAPSAFVAHWLEHKMLPTLQQAAAPVLGLNPAAVKVRVQTAAERPRAGKPRSEAVQGAAAPVAAAAGAAAARPLRRAEQAPLPLPLHVAGPAPLLWRYSFADFVVGPPNHMAVAAAQDMSQRGGCVQTLFVSSASGLGKTHLALAIAREVLQKGYHVVYVSAQSAFDAMEKERYAGGDTLAALEAAQLLILDDLGTECLSPYTASCLYSLVNTRVCRRLPTIYTTNIVRDEDLQRRYTEKLVSRLLGSCEMLAFCGEDIRLQGK